MYSDEENEYGDYGSEAEDRDDYDDFANEYREEVMFTDAYKDFGAEGRFGMARDEDLNINIVDTKHGARLSSRDMFALEVKRNIDDYREYLNENDQKIIKQNIDSLQFIKLRNPSSYVIGYILLQYPDFTINQNKLFDCLKYSKIWLQLIN